MHACTVNSSHCIVYAAAAAASCTGHYHHNFEARSGKFGRQDHRHTQTDERRAPGVDSALFPAEHTLV